ncbi:MAG: alpha/beta fold hydrolase [Polaromonas sp.]
MTSLVLVGGLNNTPAIWADVTTALNAALPDRLTLHTPVLPALNSTEAISRELLASLPARFSYVGFSFGGFVGLAMLEAEPHRFERFALVCSSTQADAESSRPARLKAMEIAAGGGHTQMIAKGFPHTVHPDRLDDAALIACREKMVPLYGAERFIAHMQACLDRPDRTEVLRRFDGPKLLVTTSHDKVVPPQLVRDVAGKVPDARFRLIEQSGHLLPLEQPSALLTELVDWLALPVLRR